MHGTKRPQYQPLKSSCKHDVDISASISGDKIKIAKATRSICDLGHYLHTLIIITLGIRPHRGNLDLLFSGLYWLLDAFWCLELIFGHSLELLCGLMDGSLAYCLVSTLNC